MTEEIYGHIIRSSFKWSLAANKMNIAWTCKSYAKDSCRGGRHTALLARKPCPSSKMLVEVELMMQLSLNGLFLCGTRGKLRSHQTIFHQVVIWRFQTTLPDFQKENYILNQMITTENDFLSLQHT